jgi:hypothetical protein
MVSVKNGIPEGAKQRDLGRSLPGREEPGDALKTGFECGQSCTFRARVFPEKGERRGGK